MSVSDAPHPQIWMRYVLYESAKTWQSQAEKVQTDIFTRNMADIA